MSRKTTVPVTVTSPAADIADYFEGAGTKLPAGALDVPEVTTIRAHSDSPTSWVDRHGTTPPPGVSFYRIDTTAPGWEQLARRKCLPIDQGGEGYTRVPTEAGMHWITIGTDDQVVLMRTRAQKKAYDQGKASLRAQRMQRRRTTRPMGGDAHLVETTDMHDQQIVLGGAG